MFKKSRSSTGAAFIKPLFWGTLFGACSCLLLFLAAAELCVLTDIPVGLVAPMAFVCVAVSAAVGGGITAKIADRKGWLYGLLCGACLYLLLSLMGFLCVKTVVGPHTPVCLLLCLVCGAFGGIIGVNVRRRRYTV